MHCNGAAFESFFFLRISHHHHHQAILNKSTLASSVNNPSCIHARHQDNHTHSA
jgi:hypothetical protein